MRNIYTYYVHMNEWMNVCMCEYVCVCVCVGGGGVRLIMHVFLFVEVLRFPHTQVYHHQPPTTRISISADRQMDKDEVYTVCEAFQFTFIFVMNDRKF